MLIPSRYNYEIECDGKKYLYNLLSVALIGIEDSSLGQIVSNHPEYKDQLRDMGFLVEDGVDEFDKYRTYFDSERYGDAARKFKITLIPTYGCNLRCPYCYQGQGKSCQKMGKAGAGRVLKFLAVELAKCKTKQSISAVDVSLFGGEPMMDKPALVEFCEGVATLAKRANLPVAFDITTNLTLLDDDMVALIRKYGIETQVTIDGTKELHDKRRITADGVGTYDLIKKNLQRLKSAGLSQYVRVRINVDNETMSQCEEMLSGIEGLYGSVYFSIIFHHAGANDCHADLCVKEKMFSEYVIRANEVLAAHGLPTPRQFGKRLPCSIVTPNRYFIDCRYDVYGCDCLINHPECKIGSIDMDGHLTLTDAYYKQLNVAITNSEKCRECKWAPACGGGCPAKKYIKDKRTNGDLECQCVIDEASLNSYLRDYIRHNLITS